MLKAVSPKLKAPVVLFTYYNPIMRRGMSNFCRMIKEAGASGARACESALGWVTAGGADAGRRCAAVFPAMAQGMHLLVSAEGRACTPPC